MTRTKLPARLFAALTALLVLLTLAATVAKARKGERHRGSIPARAAEMLEREDPRGFRTSLWALDKTPDTIKAARRVVRAAMLEAAGIDAKAGAEAAGAGPDGILVAAGDLNGDGKQDAVRWFFGDGIQAIRGSDGASMWATQFGGFGVPILVDNLDDVSGDEVITVDSSTEEITGGYRTTTDVNALSGRNGDVLWTRQYVNLWTVAKAGPTKGSADVDFAIPMAAADLDGDGADDLLMGRYDVVTVKDGGSTGLRDVRVAAVFEVISGTTGRPAAAFTGDGRFGVPDAFVMPDLTGDDADDVVVTSVMRNAPSPLAPTRMTAYSGKGGAPAWTAMLDLPGSSYLDGAELNGDDRADVLITTYYGMSFIALSGRTGTQMWTIQDPDAYYMVPAGDVNGDGGQELLLLISGYFDPDPEEGAAVPVNSLGVPALPGHTIDPYGCYGEECPPDPYGCPYGYDGCEPPVDCFPDDGYGTEGAAASSPYGYGYGSFCYADGLRLIDGALGRSLWEERYQGYVEIIDDATGDGMADAISTGFFFECVDGYGYGECTWGTDTSLISGRDGADAWEHRTTTGFTIPLWADLDGDGGSDLADLSFKGPDRYTAVSGVTGAALWPAPAAAKGSLRFLDPAALGDEGMDLLETRYRRGNFPSGARSGDDGSVLWKTPGLGGGA